MYHMHKHLIDVSAGGQLVPECIVRPGDSVSLLTWFIRYICACNKNVRERNGTIKNAQYREM